MTNLTNIFFRLSTKDKMFFARNLEIMIKSGMQILQGLEMLKKQTKSKTFITILDSLIDDIKNGRFLAVGLEKYKNVFGDFFINLVRVGEASGTLGENLQYLAEELKKKDELKNKVKGAMIYPIIILFATLGVTSIMTFIIFPKILPVIKSINVPLPAVTIAFVTISDFLLRFGYWVLTGFILFIFFFWLILKIPKARFLWHKFVLKIPVIKNMVVTVNLISFSRTTGLLLKAGTKIIEALEITAGTMSNLVYRRAILRASEGVKKGDPISNYFSEEPDLFPPIFSQMIVVGENTGKLDESVLFLANFYESELDEATKSMSNFLEPILLLVMGLVVTFVALAIITPIYKITQTLGR